MEDATLLLTSRHSWLYLQRPHLSSPISSTLFTLFPTSTRPTSSQRHLVMDAVIGQRRHWRQRRAKKSSGRFAILIVSFLLISKWVKNGLKWLALHTLHCKVQKTEKKQWNDLVVINYKISVQRMSTEIINRSNKDYNRDQFELTTYCFQI